MGTNFHSSDEILMENANMSVVCEYSEYNSNIKIVVPEEVIKNVVDYSDFDYDLQDI